MNARTAAFRVPAWRTFVWTGVVASVIAWTWAWYVGHGAQVFMVLVAFVGVALAFRAVAGMRLAVVGLMVAGFVMFIGSMYWMFWVTLPITGVNGFDVAATTLFTMASAVVLLLGAATGFRHTRDSQV